MKTKKLISFLAIMTLLVSCVKSDDDDYDIDTPSELAQQIGDTMASIDESGGTTNGSISSVPIVGYEKSFARLSGGRPLEFSDLFISKSFASNCKDVLFSACSAGSRERNFSGCALPGGGTIGGTVTLSYTGTGAASCTIPATNDAVNRIPNFNITGLRGANFAVTAASTGQTLTRASATTFIFSNTGINRKFTTSSGTVVLDTTTTATGITASGTSRTNRTLSGGVISVANNLTSATCTLNITTPLIWTASCNCPTSGVVSGTCTDDPSMSVTFGTTCGEVFVSKGTSKIVTLDRCQ